MEWHPERTVSVSSGFRFCSGRTKVTTPSAHGIPKFLPFFRCHLLPTLHHPATPFPVALRTTTESAKENLAKNQKPQRLPEADDMPAEQSRHEPVPQTHDYKSKDCKKQYCEQPKF